MHEIVEQIRIQIYFSKIKKKDVRREACIVIFQDTSHL